MKPVIFIHWNAEEAESRAQTLREAGFLVTCFSDTAGLGFRSLGDDPPQAFVIDLSRLPSHGREVAISLRQQKATRSVPLIFVRGDPQKTERIQGLLPDAFYSDLQHLPDTLRMAIEHPPANPVVPGTMDSYSGTPLVKKLGIRANGRLGLMDAPDGFVAALGELPAGVKIVAGEADVIILFARSQAELGVGFAEAIRRLTPAGKLWLAWPKKASGVPSDLSERFVRAYGLAAGYVDFKIIAVDAIWSGLCFVRRS